MSGRAESGFVNRRAYRKRRAADAARLLPVLGAALIALPLLWRGDGADAGSTAAAMLYLFLVWAGLAALAAILSRWLSDDEGEDGAEGGDD